MPGSMRRISSRCPSTLISAAFLWYIHVNQRPIRGDYGLEVTFNLVHGSDSGGSAARELALFFPQM